MSFILSRKILNYFNPWFLNYKLLQYLFYFIANFVYLCISLTLQAVLYLTALDCKSNLNETAFLIIVSFTFTCFLFLLSITILSYENVVNLNSVQFFDFVVIAFSLKLFNFACLHPLQQNQVLHIVNLFRCHKQFMNR